MSELHEVGHIPAWTVADRVRKARESARMSQSELADLSGISRSSISNYEAAATTPRRPQLVVIALATGVPVEWLQHGDVSAPEPGGPVAGGRPRQDSNLQPTVVRLQAVAA